MEMLKLGPLGHYFKNSHWEETRSGLISHIFVTFDNKYDRVTSIQFGYVENGAMVLSKKYGSENSVYHSTRIVRLNHESEFVTGISGEVCGSNISSLTFHTNERKHEAFHAEFSSSTGKRPVKKEYHSGIHDRREFAGFFGSCDSSSLSSIGLYARPILSGVNTIKQEDV